MNQDGKPAFQQACHPGGYQKNYFFFLDAGFFAAGFFLVAIRCSPPIQVE